MHLAINFIHFLYGTGRQKQTKVRSFCFKCYFWASSCKPLLHTLFLVTHRGPDRQREPTGTTGGSKLKRLARCGRQRSRIKRLGHGAVSGHRWLAGCADGCLLEFMKSFMVLLDPLSLSPSQSFLHQLITSYISQTSFCCWRHCWWKVEKQLVTAWRQRSSPKFIRSSCTRLWSQSLVLNLLTWVHHWSWRLECEYYYLSVTRSPSCAWNNQMDWGTNSMSIAF